MGKQQLIDRWNNGELSPAELVSAFSGELVARLELQGVEFSDKMVLRLESALLRRRRPDNFSVPRFLAFAERVMRTVLEDPPKSSTNHKQGHSLGDVKRSYLQAMVLKDLTLLEEREAEDAHASLSVPPNDISFSSLAFAPFQHAETSEAQDSLVLGSPVKQLMALVERLRARDSDLARFAALRLFGGLTLSEISIRTGVALAEVRGEWERLKLELDLLVSRPASPLIVLPADDNLLRTLYGHPELLRTLDWRSFERVLSMVLERIGFEIELQKGTKDGGIDIFALRADPALGAHRYLIQAKRWSHKVGVEPVRELLFLHSHYRATKSCLATTASFSRGAWRLAQEYRWQLELRDLTGLREWLDLALSKSMTTKK